MAEFGSVTAFSHNRLGDVLIWSRNPGIRERTVVVGGGGGFYLSYLLISGRRSNSMRVGEGRRRIDGFA